MRNIIFFLFSFFSVFLTSSFGEDAQAIEREQIKLWENELHDSSGLSDYEKLEKLWLGLRNMGYRAQFPGHDKGVDDIYMKLQSTLISIPGHARFFANQLVEERKKAFHPWTDSQYHRKYSWIQETMEHLPSPETVWVLGGMLESEEDSRDRDKITDFLKELRESGKTKEPYFKMTNYPTFAMDVLRSLNVRDLERPLGAGDYHRCLEACRAWWEEVKSGKRTFSFQGQSVEYRFKPDGTWDTIPISNPPDDGPKPVAARVVSPMREKPPVVSPPAKSASAPWPWLIAAFSFVMAALGFLVWKGRKQCYHRP